MGGDGRQVAVVVALQRCTSPFFSLWPSIVSVLSMPSCTSICWRLRLVHVGVVLDRGDDRRDAGRAVVQVAHQAARAQRGHHPLDRAAERRRRPGPRRARDPVLVEPRLGQRRRQAPALQPAGVEQVDQGVLAVGVVEARRPARPSAARASASRCRATSASASARSTPLDTNSDMVFCSTSSASARSEALRRAAAAGLLSSCARPADERAQGDQLLALAQRWPRPPWWTGAISCSAPCSTLGSSRSRRRNSSPGITIRRAGPPTTRALAGLGSVGEQVHRAEVGDRPSAWPSRPARPPMSRSHSSVPSVTMPK